MEKNIFIKLIMMTTLSLLLINCSTISTMLPSQNTPPVTTSSQTALWEGNTATIWNNLQSLSTARLTSLQNTINDPTQHAWIELALINKSRSTQMQGLAQALLAWQAKNPSHPANSLLPSTATLNQLASSTLPQHIALLLPMHGTYSASGQAVREGFFNGYYANISKAGKQRISIYDTEGQDARLLYQKALSEGADFVVGPLIKTNVEQLSGNGQFPATTLALNYTNRSLPHNFYEFGLLPEDEATQMAERARKEGLGRAIIIAPQNPWGERLVSTFTTQWQAMGGKIQETWYYLSNTDFNQTIARLLHVNPEADKRLMKEDNNKKVLEQQRRQDFDVIFLFSQPREARIIVPLLRYYYANNVPIYATSAIYSGKPNPAKDVDLNKVIVCDIPWKKQLSNQNEEVPSTRLYAVGHDAYLLSQTLPRLIELPHFPLYGTTGALTLSSSQQIHRRLPCRAIQDGLL